VEHLDAYRLRWTFDEPAGGDKFGQTTSGIVADGTEAQLDILEARLQGGTQADRDAVFAGLNSLRTTNTPAVPAMTGSAPTTQDAAITQLFTERAYWGWLTGKRLGDMRRLVRNYTRDARRSPDGRSPDAAGRHVRNQHEHRDSVQRAE